MHISLHQVSYNIDIFISSLCRRFSNIYKCDHILMVEKLQKFYFSDNSLRIDQVLEGFRYFLYSNFIF